MKKWKILLPSLLVTACAPIVSLTACNKEKINYTEVEMGPSLIIGGIYTSDSLNVKNKEHYKFTFTFEEATGNLGFLIGNVFASTVLDFTCDKVEVNGTEVVFECNDGKLTFSASGTSIINIYVKINEDKNDVYGFCTKSFVS